MNIKEHLEKRDFDLSKHRVFLDYNSCVAVFPLWNLSKQWVGFHQYRPNGDKKVPNDRHIGKYYTYRRPDSIVFWGMESWNFSDVLFITEGIFDACRLTKRGYSALSVLSNDINPQTKNWLWTIQSERPVISICDNDKAGKILGNYGHDSYIMQSKDLGDAPEEEVDYILNRFGHISDIGIKP